MSSALVIGGTGLVGNHLVDQLIISDSFSSVVALVRKKSLEPSNKLKEIVFDFENQDSIDHIKKAEHVFCCLGTTIKKAGSKPAFKFVDYDIPLLFGKWAEGIGASSYSIVTAMGANPSSIIFYNRIKGLIEEEIKKLKIPTIQIFQPSLIMGKRKEFRAGELSAKVIFSFLNPLLIGKAKKYRPINARTIARGMLYELKKGNQGTTTVPSHLIGKK